MAVMGVYGGGSGGDGSLNGCDGVSDNFCSAIILVTAICGKGSVTGVVCGEDTG